MMTELDIKNNIKELGGIFIEGFLEGVQKLRGTSVNYHGKKLMNLNITKNTSQNFKFYDYKGHRCVVLNAPANNNSVFIAIATTNPGLLRENNLAYKLDILSEKSTDQFVTFVGVPIDELHHSTKGINDVNNFNFKFVSSVNNLILDLNEKEEPLRFRIFSNSHTMTINEQLIYYNKQKKLLIENPDLKGLFTEDKFSLIEMPIKTDQLAQTNLFLIGYILGYKIINPDVCEKYSNVSTSNEFLDVSKQYNVKLSSYYDDIKINPVGTKTEYTPGLPENDHLN